MYKISVPIAIQSLRDNALNEDLNKYLEYFKNGNVARVFIALLPGVYQTSIENDISSYKFKKAIEFFKKADIETGVWLGGFGHGSELTHSKDSTGKRADYQKLTGVGGESFEHGYCPLDEAFEADYLNIIRDIAGLNPDLIMIDDDFRLNLRSYRLGCFCPKHLKEFYKLIGEELPRDKIEEAIFTGGNNKYRDAYLDLSEKTLMDFAKKIRAAIDSVNPDIRAGVCMVPTTYDFEGTDPISLSKAFAGSTKPFLRMFGAPYHDKYTLIRTIERERMELHWLKSAGEAVEVFTEGDVYPRPRYNVPSKSLELFEAALLCDGSSHGCLKYMFPYDYPIGYETGYIDKHIKNSEVMKHIQEIFKDKTPTGVSVFCQLHKIRDYIFPEQASSLHADSNQWAWDSWMDNWLSNLLSKNSIPTTFDKSEYPIAVMGEDARYVSCEMLSNGAVLDSVAAMILQERGLDTGLLKIEQANDSTGEFFIKEEDSVSFSYCCKINKMTVSDNAEILSLIMPSEAPGAYIYQNKDGIRFFVLAADFKFSNSSDYFNSYYRQKQVVESIEWVGKKRLPATLLKNPNLYIMTSKGKNSMSVLLLNIFMDEITKPEIKLSDEYSDIKFINCDGSLDGNTVYLSELGPYSFAAFEVFY